MAVVFHTTALCTTGTVSLGSRGRCFFSAGVVGAEGEEDEAGAAVALDTVVRLMVAGEGEVNETMETGMATVDCVETLEGVEGAVELCEGGVDETWALPTREIVVIISQFINQSISHQNQIQKVT